MCYIFTYSSYLFFFFFNDPATTEIYTLSLHDALPICFASFTAYPIAIGERVLGAFAVHRTTTWPATPETASLMGSRSEEHTSELQSQFHLVCRLLLEKKKKKKKNNMKTHSTNTKQ